MRGPPETSKPDQPTLSGNLKEVVGGIVHLLGQHVALARAELTANIRHLATTAAVLALMAVPVLLGYALAMVALALVLARVVDRAAAFAIVGGGNVLLGGLGVWLAVRQLRSIQVGGLASSELRESMNLIANSATTSAASSATPAPNKSPAAPAMAGALTSPAKDEPTKRDRLPALRDHHVA